LPAALARGKARGVGLVRLPKAGSPSSLFIGALPVVKPEWGTKRSCPKCGTRFYDLGKDDPISCIECGVNFEAETILKSKQPMPFDAPKPAAQKETEDADLAEDLDVDEDEEPSADDDVDLGGDDDIGVDTGEKEEDH
jgi:uncharacterized protein (TIGR02300 family)